MSPIVARQGPSFSSLMIAIGATLFTAGVIHGSLLSRGYKVPTLSAKYRSATEEYMKFQKMNPITGISKGL